MKGRVALILLTVSMAAALALAQSDPLTRPYPADVCADCAAWNAPHRPVHLFGNTYYVGTEGLGSVLIASPEGHVLIDGGLPDSAPRILANIRALGFDPRDVTLILGSHAHFDHAGGFAALQRETGARVAVRAAAADVLRSGVARPGDPQYGSLPPMPRVPEVAVLEETKAIRVGPLSLTPHATGGHTPGGTTWTWRSCEGARCVDLVYADSLTPISSEGFRFRSSAEYPNALADFERAFGVLETIPCDVLITPHPGASGFWERVAAGPAKLIDAGACRRYAAAARKSLETRLETEGRE